MPEITELKPTDIAKMSHSEFKALVAKNTDSRQYEILCPNCGQWSRASDWGDEVEAYCEDCGCHAALMCPMCHGVTDVILHDVSRRICIL